MMFVVVTLVHVADTLEQLNTDTEALLSVGGNTSASSRLLNISRWTDLILSFPTV